MGQYYNRYRTDPSQGGGENFALRAADRKADNGGDLAKQKKGTAYGADAARTTPYRFYFSSGLRASEC